MVVVVEGEGEKAAGIKALDDSNAVSVSLPGSQLPHRQLLLPLATRYSLSWSYPLNRSATGRKRRDGGVQSIWDVYIPRTSVFPSGF